MRIWLLSLLITLCIGILAVPIGAYAKEEKATKALNSITFEASIKTMEALSAALEGDVEKEQSLYQEALDIYNKGLDDDPENVRLLKGRGLVLDQIEAGSGKDDFNAVIKLTTEKIEQTPDHAYSYYHRAGAYRSLEQYDKAREDYKKAIELNPKRENWPMDLKAMEIQAKHAD